SVRVGQVLNEGAGRPPRAQAFDPPPVVVSGSVDHATRVLSEGREPRCVVLDSFEDPRNPRQQPTFIEDVIQLISIRVCEPDHLIEVVVGLPGPELTSLQDAKLFHHAPTSVIAKVAGSG